MKGRDFLVALDLDSGVAKWSQPFDFSACHHMIYMAYSGGKLLVTGTDKEKVFAGIQTIPLS